MASDPLRWRNMTLAKNRELSRAPKEPGAFVARLTREYTPRQQANRQGMTIQNMLKSCETPEVPVLHKHRGSAGGKTTELVADTNDRFLYVHGKLDLASKTGQKIQQKRQNGKLRFVSAAFTVPPLDHPDPENFPCRLEEVSFVNKPHEPHAEVFACHSTSEGGQLRSRITLCSEELYPSAMSSSSSSSSPSNPEQSQGPKVDLAGLSAEAKAVFAKLFAEKSELEEKAKKLPELQKEYEDAKNELSSYKEEERKAMLPKIARIEEKYKNVDKLNPDDFAGRLGSWDALSQNRATAFVVNEHVGLMDRYQELEQKYQEAVKSQQAATTDVQSTLQQSQLAAMQQQQQVQPQLMNPGNFAAQNNPMTTSQPPMIAQHGAGGKVMHKNQVQTAKELAAAIAKHRAEWESPAAKRKTTAD